MSDFMTRRQVLGAAASAGAASLAFTAAPVRAAAENAPKVLGIAASPRKGMTTATAVQAALDAVAKVDPVITTELIDLGGLQISGWTGGARLGEGQEAEDDFDQILPKLRDPAVCGWIIGSPVYFRTMSSLCKAFLERCAVLRSPNLLLADMPVGALAVGAYRNGGQELVIEQIQVVMLCHEALIVGGKPRAHQGATLWNAWDDDITQDEFGMSSAALLGQRVGELALRKAGRS